jgi:predicted RNase H-like HicB family nuclease
VVTSYPIVIVELPAAEGGGHLGAAPDLPGCLSDGATPDEALRNTQDATNEWLAAARSAGRPIPPASAAAERNRARECALIGAVRALADVPHDDRAARLSSEIDRLRSITDREDAWTSLDPPPPARSAG